MIFLISIPEENTSVSSIPSDKEPLVPGIEICIKELNNPENKNIECSFIWKYNSNGKISCNDYVQIINFIIHLLCKEK